jgi:hypothetical protein
MITLSRTGKAGGTVPLTTTGTIGTAEVEEICQLEDPVYRNCWITFGYWKLSERLHPYIGDNASWCTFARWSSFTVGESLRLETDSRRIDDVFSGSLNRFRGVAQSLYRDLRALSDSAMPRILAQGNHFVFHEIGHAVAHFLEWYEREVDILPRGATAERRGAWESYREEIEAFAHGGQLFRAADVSWLRDGLESYFEAMQPDLDQGVQGQLVLRGNILLAAYEQWRLDPIVRIALDPLAKHLVEFRSVDLHGSGHAPGDYPRAVLRHKGTQWESRHQSSIGRWAADQYAATLTRHWMSLTIPIDSRTAECVVVGKGIPAGVANAAFPRLRRVDDPDLMKLISVYDHNQTPRIRGADNWTSYSDRMQFIVEMFLGLQTKEHLYQPTDPAEVKLLELDLDPEHLDSMRLIGDQDLDDFVAQHCAGQNIAPRELVRDLVRDGVTESSSIGVPADLQQGLPAWHDAAKLRRGQQFFRENAIEIATALFSASLPLSYTAEHGARVLTSTAEMASGNVNRRVAETGRLLLDIMTVDDTNGTPLDRDTAAARAATGVRLFHSAVRQMLLAHGWDTPTRGLPVNQEDLYGTLVVFTVVVLDSLDKMGVVVDDESRDAYVHLWMVIGYILGIDFSLIHRPDGPSETRSDAELSLEEVRVLGNVLWGRNARMTADGQELSAALMQMFHETMARGMKSFPAAATRILIGDETADLLDVPNGGAPARLALRAARPVTRLISRGRIRGLIQRNMQGSTLQLYQRWITMNHGDRPPWEVGDPALRATFRLNGSGAANDRRSPSRQ